MAGYYAKTQTRSSGATNKGTAAQAMNYLTDDHDTKRMGQVSDAEMDYMARVNPGHKTDLEGGRIPLLGYGRCIGLAEKEMRATFEAACKPSHLSALGYMTRGSEGYKSHVLTLPKELSLVAETNSKAAKQAIEKALHEVLEKTYAGKELAAVAAVHTRNANGEIHFHAHVLVGKFVEDRATGKIHSINNAKAMGGNARESGRLKEHWQASINQEMEKAFQIKIENQLQGRAIVTFSDGVKLAPLNRVSRREMEVRMAPEIRMTDSKGEARTRRFTLTKMDQKIFENTFRDRGKGGWDREVFLKTFPKELDRIERYEKRVQTLQSVGYLTHAGRVTEAFRNHAEVKWGKDSPQLQQIRVDLENQKKAVRYGTLTVPTGNPLSRAVVESSAIQDRVKNLGLQASAIREAERGWQEAKAKVTPEQKVLIQLEKRLERLNSEEKSQMGSVSITDRGMLMDRFQESRVSLESEIPAAWEKAALSLKHPDRRDPEKILREELWQHNKALMQIERKLAGVDRSRAERLEGKTDPAVMARIEKWHGQQRMALEGTRGKLVGEISVRRKAMIAFEIKPAVSDRSGRFKEVGRYQKPQAGGDQVLSRVSGHLGGLVQAVRRAFQVWDEVKTLLTRVPKEKVDALRVGADLLRRSGQPEGRLLTPWRGREGALAGRVLLDQKGGGRMPLKLLEATKSAGRVGNDILKAQKLLNESPSKVSGRLKALEGPIQRFNTRTQAMGFESPLSKPVLEAISPKALAVAFKEDPALEKLSGCGNEWALLQSQVVNAAMGKMQTLVKVALETGQGQVMTLPL